MLTYPLGSLRHEAGGRLAFWTRLGVNYSAKQTTSKGSYLESDDLYAHFFELLKHASTHRVVLRRLCPLFLSPTCAAVLHSYQPLCCKQCQPYRVASPLTFCHTSCSWLHPNTRSDSHHNTAPFSAARTKCLFINLIIKRNVLIRFNLTFLNSTQNAVCADPPADP